MFHWPLIEYGIISKRTLFYSVNVCLGMDHVPIEKLKKKGVIMSKYTIDKYREALVAIAEASDQANPVHLKVVAKNNARTFSNLDFSVPTFFSNFFCGFFSANFLIEIFFCSKLQIMIFLNFLLEIFFCSELQITFFEYFSDF